MKYNRLRRSSMQVETWSSPEIKNHIETVNRLAIVPLGSFEQHGPHAPLGTDTFICLEICRRIARNLKGVMLPPIWFSVSQEHMDYTGTITICPETFCNYVSDIILSLASGGFSKILVLNGHGTNEVFFPSIQAKVKDKIGDQVGLSLLSYWTALPPEEQEFVCSLKWGMHANAFETSLILEISPSVVKNVGNCSCFPDTTGLTIDDIDAGLFRKLIKGSNGVWGDPEQASRETGKSMLAKIELALSAYLTDIGFGDCGADPISADRARH